MTTDALTGVLYFLAFGFLFYWMMKQGGCGMHAHGHGGHAAHGARTEEGGSDSTVDPVCGMRVDPARAAAKRTVSGHTFYFCSPTCLEKFDRDPQGYAKRSAPTGPGRPHQLV